MNITYKEYKEKLKIEFDEFKEKLKSKLDEFKAKQNKKLENFKLKNSKKNKRSSKRKIKGGDLSEEEIDEVINVIIDIYKTIYKHPGFDSENDEANIKNIIKEFITSELEGLSENIKNQITEDDIKIIFNNQKLTNTKIYELLKKEGEGEEEEIQVLNYINDLIISFFKKE